MSFGVKVMRTATTRRRQLRTRQLPFTLEIETRFKWGIDALFTAHPVLDKPILALRPNLSRAEKKRALLFGLACLLHRSNREKLMIELPTVGGMKIVDWT
jgi:hypothetical protein